MKMSDWWKGTFGEAYFTAFDASYSEEKGRSETEFLAKKIRLKKGRRVLDLACGQGRHSVAFALLGMDVTGVDTSATLLKVARQRAGKAGVRIDFQKRDMRMFVRRGSYDVVTILGNSFGYFGDTDNCRVIKNASRSLRKGGCLILDLSNTPGMLKNGGIQGEWKQTFPNGTLTTRAHGFDPSTFMLGMQWRIKTNGRTAIFDGFLRLYTPPEIRTILEMYGFKVTNLFGSFSDEPYGIETRRCLVMAQKA